MKCDWDNDLLKEAKKSIRHHKYFDCNPANLLSNATEKTISQTHKKMTKDFAYLSHFPFYESYLYQIIDDYVNIIYPIKSHKINLSEQDIFDLTYDFYKWLDDGLFTDFKKRFDERGTHIKFRNVKHANNALGKTYYYSNIKETFISIYNSHNLSSVLTAIHEYAHAIWYNRFDNNYRLQGRDAYLELESIFLEMLAIDYFSKFTEFTKDAKLERASLVNSFIAELRILYNKYYIFNEYIALKAASDGEITYKDFLTEIKASLEITKKEIKHIFNEPASSIMPYSLGELVSFELYHIFQNDPERALWLYKIILSKNPKNAEEMDYEIKKLGIYPTTHIETFTRKLAKH